MSIQLTRSYDVDALNALLTHPKVYPHIADDMAAGPDDFTVGAIVDNPSVIFVAAMKHGEMLGAFMFIKTNGVTYDVHSAVHPEHRGRLTPLMAKGAVKWMFDNTDCMKVETKVPSYNRLAKKLTEAVGLTYEGTSRMSFLKNGKLYDQLLYGITREEF